MSGISMILVILVAFLAGVEGILDEFEFHQPLVACTLIGIVTGQLGPCLVLGGSLQMMALGWANIGAAVSPDAALASVASAIILVVGGQGLLFTRWMQLLRKATLALLKFGSTSLSACRVSASPSRLPASASSRLKSFRALCSPCLNG